MRFSYRHFNHQLPAGESKLPYSIRNTKSEFYIFLQDTLIRLETIPGAAEAGSKVRAGQSGRNMAIRHLHAGSQRLAPPHPKRASAVSLRLPFRETPEAMESRRLVHHFWSDWGSRGFLS